MKHGFYRILYVMLFVSTFLYAQPNHTLPANLAEPGAPVLTLRVTDTVFGEGVAADWQGNMYYNEMGPRNRTMILPVGKDSSKAWRNAKDAPNGIWLDSKNGLVICQQHAIIRVKPGATYDNVVDTLYKDSLKGKDFNDVTGDSKDNLFFTNFLGGAVFFRNAATKITTRVLVNQPQPNGVEWDEERKRLYVGENGNSTVAYYTVNADYSLSNRTFLDTVHWCDGMVIDELGNFYVVAFGDGVQVYSPDKTLLGKISLPNYQLTNLAFGGADFKTLYLITNIGLYKLPMKVKGYKTGMPSTGLERLGENSNQKHNHNPKAIREPSFFGNLFKGMVHLISGRQVPY